jgi:hypothetical protein
MTRVMVIELYNLFFIGLFQSHDPGRGFDKLTPS